MGAVSTRRSGNSPCTVEAYVLHNIAHLPRAPAPRAPLVVQPAAVAPGWGAAGIRGRAFQGWWWRTFLSLDIAFSTGCFESEIGCVSGRVLLMDLKYDPTPAEASRCQLIFDFPAVCNQTSAPCGKRAFQSTGSSTPSSPPPAAAPRWRKWRSSAAARPTRCSGRGSRRWP